ncbi:hypothetical protein [Siminovitchia terrae]|nr:hypothetical protein [Siminovitchia terrae]
MGAEKGFFILFKKGDENMQYNTDTLWNTFWSDAFMSAAYLLGGVDHFVIGLIIVWQTII